MDSMRAADANNWSLNAEELATLASSLNEFFQRTGIVNTEQSQTKEQSNGNPVLTSDTFLKDGWSIAWLLCWSVGWLFGRLLTWLLRC